MEQLTWSCDADRDLSNIYNYINKDSLYYSMKTISKIIELVNELKISPYMGRKIPEYNENCKRELIYKSYRIMYKIEFNKILIHRIWHSARLVTKKLIS